MRAVRVHELTGPGALRVDEVPDLQAAPGQVVVDVKAAGVNFPDILITQGKYQFKPALPFSPGGEVAGVVRAVGAGSKITEFKALARIDTPQEALYYQHGGILQYVLRQLLAGKEKPDVVSKGMATMADPATGSSLS